MRVDTFDFALPEELIALRPIVPRDGARLLVVGRDGTIAHHTIHDLPRILARGDMLMVNDTRVIAARLEGTRPARTEAGSNVAVEVLLNRRIEPGAYSALVRPARRLRSGDELDLGRSLHARIRSVHEAEAEIEFDLDGDALDRAIAEQGKMPLPPYIARKRKADARDNSDYQTTFAAALGSVAAPTAGLHFTSELLAGLEHAGIARRSLTLHVGPGTFLPVRAEDTSAHRMHPEWAHLSQAAADALNAARASGGRIAAVGTTALRTLETAADEDGTLRAFAGDTDLFITPGYRFKTAEILLTNFHLPRSTLFMLVCAFAGTETMKRAYAEAIRERYRFYSYGDACLLFRAPQ
jgi:S-adenosylmethionine:tRNA ribosyltransferase-isomerase